MVPRDWLPANDYTDCMEARLWESKEFGEDSDKDLFVASDGSGGSNETLKILETGRFDGGHFLVVSWGRPTRPVFLRQILFVQSFFFLKKNKML